MISIEEAAELVVKENLSTEKEVYQYVRDNFTLLNISNASEASNIASVMNLIVNSDVDNKEILQRTKKESKLVKKVEKD